ncbi:hypothetical protein J2X31_003403 [Flavobacterium arsenatis]|uniref:Lipoprotein n=1 Tax=Flavobacterium arsenatis TaxID=1484332 RepID=A0ABU1TU14_9FLAO|nr:hypothetical protein [Flavobacterium arsenatis]MDR6969372.1 hypothetical protein [Flavobacterium arsenatis]
MKHNYLLAVLVMAFLTSCSTSDDSATPEEPTANNYFPIENGDFWVYDVNGDFPGRDSLYIANDTTINNTPHKKFKTKDLPFGFYSSSLTGNGIRKSGDKLMVSGAIDIDLIEGFPVDLAVSDFIIFKENASDNEQLSSISGSINYQFDEIPLTFNYTMKSVFAETLASFAVPGHDTYQNVKVIKVIVNLNVGGVVSFQGVNFPFNVMNSQDVVVSTQYYANNVGMVYSTTDIHYELANMEIALPIPSTATQNIKEYLVNHSGE